MHPRGQPARRSRAPAPLYAAAVPARAAADGGAVRRTSPEALANSVEIARRCSLLLRLGESRLPEYPVPAGTTPERYLREAAARGLAARGAPAAPAPAVAAPGGEGGDTYQRRLQSELDVICSMGFAGYFLIVADFIRWARHNGVPVGPGRGSGAGSLVAYALGITDIDPLRYDLLFERFLNPERVSMPDFDIDFCMDGRDRVIEYVAAKYGPRAGVADHHLRHDGGEGRGARRRARARPSLRHRRPHRQARALRTRDDARQGAREGARAQAAVSRRRGGAHADRPGALARGPDAQRRQARRRRRDRALGADRFRAAVLRAGRRQRRHAVRQGRRRGRGAGQVRLPRAAHADGARLGGAQHQRRAGRGRGGAARAGAAADG